MHLKEGPAEPAVLTEYDRARYTRQMLVEGWGEGGQARIQSSSVFVAGAGGLGSPVALYLAAAGIGELHLCDSDRVELSNLNRQILHTDARIGQSKAVSAGQTLRELNPEVRIRTWAERLDEPSVARIVGRPDIVVDCLDNYDTRYLLNAYCLRRGIPQVHAAIWGLIGQVTFLQPPETPCLRCIFPEAPPRGVFPVVGATPGLVGCIQALEVLKYLTGIGTLLKNRLLIVDGADMDFQCFTLRRNPACPDCGPALSG